MFYILTGLWVTQMYAFVNLQTYTNNTCVSLYASFILREKMLHAPSIEATKYKANIKKENENKNCKQILKSSTDIRNEVIRG